jgi:hypothetical protein
MIDVMLRQLDEATTRVEKAHAAVCGSPCDRTFPCVHTKELWDATRARTDLFRTCVKTVLT